MIDILDIANNADMIVNGFAFTRSNVGYRVLNLNNTEEACLLSEQGDVLSTDMDDKSLEIVKQYFVRNFDLMENIDA